MLRPRQSWCLAELGPATTRRADLPRALPRVPFACARHLFGAHQHPDGGGKARYLARLGYTRADWPKLDRDLRHQMLRLDARLAGEDLPREGLRAGDVGVVVEHYEARGSRPEGYELEFFSARGDTVAVVSVPATAIRAAESHELLAVRRFRAS